MQSREYQEIEEERGGFESGAINRLAMLTLNTTIEPPLPSSAERCTICCSSVKRRSPSSSFLQEPTPKKQQLTLLNPTSSSSAATKLLLPITSQNASPPLDSNSLPILRRCVSDPINSPGTTNAGAPSAQFLNHQSPHKHNAKTDVSSTMPSPAKETASLPPLPRALRRSVSDPTRSGYHLMPTTTSTAPHAAPKTSSQSPNTTELGLESIRGDSPSSKRLKRMKDRMREMLQWWDEVMREGQEDGGCEDNNNADGNNETTTEDECAETETEEAVSVERTGECLIIHFECPCNKGYQILLSGKNCYYKLM